jgi:hypothetical protein
MVSNQKAVHHHILHQGEKGVKRSPGSAQLTYYIFEGVLVGFVGTEQISLSAWSGGAGGSTKHGTDSSANNPYMYALKEVDDKKKKIHVHGGPIPPGRYTVLPPGHHAKFGLSSKLEPERRLPNDRGGFYIHGQGPHGSDGCIVPGKADFPNLMEKLKASNGGSLYVFQAMEGAFA